MSRRKESLMEISRRVISLFSDLNNLQLNYQINPGKWSIGQCLEHIIVSNKTYFPTFEQIRKGQYKPSFWAKISPFSKKTGKQMISSLGPSPAKKYKSPRIFQPSTKNVTENIVQIFTRHQETLSGMFEKFEQLKNEELIIPSPASPLITYSLADCMDMIIAHELRHVEQAERVLNFANFPK